MAAAPAAAAGDAQALLRWLPWQDQEMRHRQSVSTGKAQALQGHRRKMHGWGGSAAAACRLPPLPPLGGAKWHQQAAQCAFHGMTAVSAGRADPRGLNRSSGTANMLPGSAGAQSGVPSSLALVPGLGSARRGGRRESGRGVAGGGLCRSSNAAANA